MALAAAVVLPLSAAVVPATASPAVGAPSGPGTYLVGRGLADITGEPGENGMAGYGDGKQLTAGVHMRQHARAFVIADPASGKRLLYVLGDILTGESKMRREILARLAAVYGDRYGESNVMIAGIHTHATPGGTGEYSLYNVTTMGTHRDTFRALTDGVLAAVARAEADLAPTSIHQSASRLTTASVNRSRRAHELNPAGVKAELPGGIDPRSETLTFDRGGRTVGALNWFATHPTSLTAKNRLISTDNKGYAQWLWERRTAGVDYEAVAQGVNPAMVAGFAMSNGGDASSNLNLKPGSGPTEDPFENMRVIGERQFRAAYDPAQTARRAVAGGVDARIVYVDMPHQDASAVYTGSGGDERTCEPVLGASFGAGSTEDGSGGPPFLSEGPDGNTPFESQTNTAYALNPVLRRCQAPKKFLFRSGLVDGVQTVLPVQVFRIGDVVLLGMPGELTAAAGVRMRHVLARAAGVSPERVFLQSVTNAYGHYFTTPQEYTRQDYEGGATVFGRWTVPVLEGVVAHLGRALRDGTPVAMGVPPSPKVTVESAVGKVVHDAPTPGEHFGQQVAGPGLGDKPRAVAAGSTVQADFVGAHPNNSVSRRTSLMRVERRTTTGWERVADDNDPDTRFSWTRVGVASSKVALSWTVPAEARPGTYRFVYTGDAKVPGGRLEAIVGEGEPFDVK
ncbi:neutral/alkaline non-lysosomal ceramidase N-terminal domain-containing protein [Austwickia chelonae]|uniref:neutral/alkaline non-lysosomal ceramidase N-terminal domain-containing protein n=1 Tax=Austwickia chelonae TaxID=100225 RepID=UPI0013C2FAE0|nr:neutral/alkaline non-lysosomal ceramidase N-terminal domain-containing protein [Austwickia chelonae]